MICQRCGVLEATVHFSDPGHSPRKFQWLCSKCADMIVASLVTDDASKPEDKDASQPNEKAWDPTAINAEIANSQKGELLGKMFGLSVDDTGSDDVACSKCGLQIQQFRQSGLLGCPQCYAEFRTLLRSFLSRLHGHTSHLGQIPGHDDGTAAPHVQIMRLKVDLEKAIAAEEFEKAAILRDEIVTLKESSQAQGMVEDGDIS